MLEYNNDFSPEWISKDLGVDFEDIMNVFKEVDLDDSIMKDQETSCGKNLEMILSIS